MTNEQTSIPIVETERLILRPVKLEDAQDMLEYCSDPAVSQYVSWKPYTSINEMEKGIQNFFLRKKALGLLESYALVYKANHKMIGTCDLTCTSSRNRTYEIGYCLNPEYQHQGLMSEAVKKVLEVAFTVYQAHRIEILTYEENTASRTLIERLGGIYEGTRKSAFFGSDDQYHDLRVYRFLEKEPNA